jgi:three-Cys-motif partner protein
METIAKSELKVHSQAKIEFYVEYLKRYLRILSLAKDIKRINIYDVFCGKGIYDGGGKGSPIVAFDAIKELVSEEKFKKTGTQITLIVNDKEQQNIKQVRDYIDSNNHNVCEIKYHTLDIDNMFPIVLSEVSKCASDTRNIIFIDPYGYKNIEKEMLYNLMRNQRTEIILFLPISYMHRFTQKAIQDEDTAQYEPLRKFINSFFDPNHKIVNEHLSVMEYIQFITDALRYNNMFYTTSYYIERSSTCYFALFFISSHIFGFEKILDVKWQLDEKSGRGFRIQPVQTNLFEEHFAQEEKYQNATRLESILLELLKKPKTNKQIYEETLRHEFLPKHTTPIFKKWQSENKNFKIYDIKTGKEVRKKSFYISYADYKNTDVQFRIEE